MGSSEYSGGESESGGSTYSYEGKKVKKDKKDKKEKKDKDKDKDTKDKDKKDKDKKDKEKKEKDGHDHKEKDKDKDKKDKDKDKGKEKKEKDEDDHKEKGKDKEKKDKDKGKEKKEKDDDGHKEKGKDKDKDKKDKGKEKKEKGDDDHKEKDKKDKDKKDKDKHSAGPSYTHGIPAATPSSLPAAAGGSSGFGGAPSFPSAPGYHNPALGISYPSQPPPPFPGAPPVAKSNPNQMSEYGPPPSGYRVPLDTNDHSKPFASLPSQETGPPVTYDLDGSPIFIGSILFENSVHPGKIGPHLDPPAQVAYGGVESGHRGRYDLLPFVPDQMEWVPTGHGRIPQGRTPVEGGYEEGGEKLYHALAVVDNVKVPGKTGEHLGGCNVGFGGAELSIQEGYEILCWKY